MALRNRVKRDVAKKTGEEMEMTDMRIPSFFLLICLMYTCHTQISTNSLGWTQGVDGLYELEGALYTILEFETG